MNLPLPKPHGLEMLKWLMFGNLSVISRKGKHTCNRMQHVSHERVMLFRTQVFKR